MDPFSQDTYNFQTQASHHVLLNIAKTMTMKKPLGKGLSPLMKESQQGDGVFRSAGQGMQHASSANGPMKGVSRLIHGHETGESHQNSSGDTDNPFHGEEEVTDVVSTRQVPDWLFYLGDLVLLSMVVWMVVLSPNAPTPVDWFNSLMITFLAALLGGYPWLRNVLSNTGSVQAEEIPQWSLAYKQLPDGTEKIFVIHLHPPFTAVEITETSWSGVIPKPIWLSGSPDISPDHMKRLLMGAAKFYKGQRDPSDARNKAISVA